MATQNHVSIKKTTSSNRRPVRRRKKKNLAGRILFSFAIILLIVLSVVLSFTVFFKVRTIDIYGQSRYSESVVKKIGGIKLEDNLLLVNSKKISEKIESQLPYIEQVKINKKFPSTLKLTVKPATVLGYARHKENYYILSTNGKILEIVSNEPELLRIDGFDLKDKKVAQNVGDDKKRLTVLGQMTEIFGDDILKITEIDLTDIINITFKFDNRITVELGSISDVFEKLKFTKAILLDKDKISDEDIGTIYVSDSKKMSFRRSEKNETESQSESTVSDSEQTESQNPD